MYTDIQTIVLGDLGINRDTICLLFLRCICICVCISVSVCAYVTYVQVGTCKGQDITLDSLDLELQAVISHSTQVLESNPDPLEGQQAS